MASAAFEARACGESGWERLVLTLKPAADPASGRPPAQGSPLSCSQLVHEGLPLASGHSVRRVVDPPPRAPMMQRTSCTAQCCQWSPPCSLDMPARVTMVRPGAEL